MTSSRCQGNTSHPVSVRGAALLTGQAYGFESAALAGIAPGTKFTAVGVDSQGNVTSHEGVRDVAPRDPKEVKTRDWGSGVSSAATFAAERAKVAVRVSGSALQILREPGKTKLVETGVPLSAFTAPPPEGAAARTEGGVANFRAVESTFREKRLLDFFARQVGSGEGRATVTCTEERSTIK